MSLFLTLLVNGSCEAEHQDALLQRGLEANKGRNVIWQMFCDRLRLAGGSVSKAEAYTMGAQRRYVCTARGSFSIGFFQSPHNACT